MVGVKTCFLTNHGKLIRIAGHCLYLVIYMDIESQFFQLKNGIEVVLTFFPIFHGVIHILQKGRNQADIAYGAFMLVLGSHFFAITFSNYFRLDVGFYAAICLMLYGPLIYSFIVLGTVQKATAIHKWSWIIYLLIAIAFGSLETKGDHWYVPYVYTNFFLIFSYFRSNSDLLRTGPPGKMKRIILPVRSNQ